LIKPVIACLAISLSIFIEFLVIKKVEQLGETLEVLKFNYLLLLDQKVASG